VFALARLQPGEVGEIAAFVHHKSHKPRTLGLFPVCRQFGSYESVRDGGHVSAET
jgi:hypothetical protein